MHGMGYFSLYGRGSRWALQQGASGKRPDHAEEQAHAALQRSADAF